MLKIHKKPVDPGLLIFKNIFNSSLPKSIISYFIGGLVNTYIISDNFDQLFDRFNSLNLQIKNDLNRMYINPFEKLDTIYNIPLVIDADQKTISLHDLLLLDIPNKNSDEFNTLLELQKNKFRTAICKHLILNKYNWSIIEIQPYEDKCISLTNNNIFPANKTPLFVNYWNQCLSSNTYMYSCSNKIPDFDIVTQESNYESYVKIMGEFVSKIGAVYILNKNIENKYYYFTYFLASSYNNSSWNMVDKSITDWLFIDDGFGNIINPNGCGTREDIFRNWGIKFGENIPNYNNISIELINNIKNNKIDSMISGSIYENL